VRNGKSTRTPYDEPEYQQPRCGHCGAFLSEKADRVEPWEDWNMGPDGRSHIIAAGYTYSWDCKKCGREWSESV